MRLFIDCEWNEFRGTLISMALVPMTGKPFYEVVHCGNPKEWVRKNVMPVLGKQPIGGLDFTNKLNTFLCQFDEIEVIADWPEDIEYFCYELITGPGYRIGPDKMTFIVDRSCGNDNSKVLHNALEDAIAIRDSYIKAH